MPKRLGQAEGGGTSAKACSDSSQGSATVQPAPRSTARREMGNANFLADMLASPFGMLSAPCPRLSEFPPMCAHVAPLGKGPPEPPLLLG
jgi:hypothetical protein